MDAIRHEVAEAVLEHVAAYSTVSIYKLLRDRKRQDLREARQFAAFVLTRRLGFSEDDAAEALECEPATLHAWLIRMDVRVQHCGKLKEAADKVGGKFRRELQEKYGRHTALLQAI